MATLNCSQVVARSDFVTYFATLLNLTNGDIDVLQQCEQEVCSALWGQGNSDISGIGMIIGYFLEQVVGLVLVIGALVSIGMIKHVSLGQYTLRALESFHNCATFFAFSIEIASVIVLVREDFGISTSGMGDGTVRITQAVSILVLLPLMYGILGIPVVRQALRRKPTSSGHVADDEKEAAPSSRRFALLVLCWLLACYAFYSKMNAAFGPNQILAHGWKTQFAAIQTMCSHGVSEITTTEDALMTTFVMLAFIPVTVFVLGSIIMQGLQKHHGESTLYAKLTKHRPKLNAGHTMLQLLISLAWILICVCGLLWSVLRAQEYQKGMATMTGAGDSDDTWTFGQVVALTVFIPVLFDLWSERAEAKSEASDVEEEK